MPEVGLADCWKEVCLRCEEACCQTAWITLALPSPSSSCCLSVRCEAQQRLKRKFSPLRFFVEQASEHRSNPQGVCIGWQRRERQARDERIAAAESSEGERGKLGGRWSGCPGFSCTRTPRSESNGR